MARPTTLVERLRAAGCVFAEEEAAMLTSSCDAARLEGAVRRRIAGEPLEHVVGFVELAGRRFHLSPDTFIPRQRSTLLVEEAIRLGGRTIVDLCCGCGALGLAVQDGLPDSRLTASDLAESAVADARRNGADAHVGDLDSGLPDALVGCVDLLLCNAPYVPTSAIDEMPRESRDHEPRSTVDGGDDGMALQRRLFEVAPRWLGAGGHLLTETSRAQAPRLARIARSGGLDAWVVEDPDPERAATVLVATVPAP